jgi:NAD(P)-dependent dehydrogenase (short-subunit alcohol dehydrogenase family)
MSALQYAPGITVNAVAPGLILPPEGKDEGYLNGLARSLPLKRHGDPADITSAVSFLLESNFVTGQVIYVDGGRHLIGGAR